MDVWHYTGMLPLSLSMVPAGRAPRASTGPRTASFRRTPVISCCGGLQPPSCYFGNFETHRYWRKCPRGDRRLHGMYHAHEQGAVCLHIQAVWKRACLWSVMSGRFRVGQYLLLQMYQGGLSGGSFWGRRPLQGWKSPSVPGSGACGVALKHHGMREAERSSPHLTFTCSLRLQAVVHHVFS